MKERSTKLIFYQNLINIPYTLREGIQKRIQFFWGGPCKGGLGTHCADPASLQAFCCKVMFCICFCQYMYFSHHVKNTYFNKNKYKTSLCSRMPAEKLGL